MHSYLSDVQMRRLRQAGSESRFRKVSGETWRYGGGKYMASETVQQVVEYLKAHPDVAKKAMDYVKAHPDDVKAALKDVAAERGWDLSKIDTTALKAEMGKIAQH